MDRHRRGHRGRRTSTAAQHARVAGAVCACNVLRAAAWGDVVLLCGVAVAEVVLAVLPTSNLACGANMRPCVRRAFFAPS